MQKRKEIEFDGLKILLIKYELIWTAISIDYSVTAQGDTPDDAFNAFMYTFMGQMAVNATGGQDPMEKMSPAPDIYREIFDKSILKVNTTEEPKLGIPSWVPNAHVIRSFQEQDLRVG